jgi:hypothetical protein
LEKFKFGFIGAFGLQVRGGEGGEAPFTPSGWPAVSGAALSAPTRAVAQENFCLPSSAFQFSCGHSRASEGRRNTKVNKYSKLLVAAYKCR